MTLDTEAASIAMVKANDLNGLRGLIQQGADLDAVDEHGWTALCWAASRGNVAAVDVLAQAGADVFKAGEDKRTPYKIALAASHKDTARRLRELEEAAGSDRECISSRAGDSRLYCKGYRVSDLSRFPQWRELTAATTLAPEAVVFLHQNYVLTQSIWHDKDVVLEKVTPEWRAFCDDDLAFKVPDDFDLMTA